MSDLEKVVNLNFRVTEARRRDFKAWSARNGMTQTEAFNEAFDLMAGMREIFGDRPAHEILEIISGASRFSLDERGDVTVEARGHGKWAVSFGSSVLNTFGEREYEPMPSGRDDDFIARTRFTLSEALLLGRAYLADNGNSR